MFARIVDPVWPATGTLPWCSGSRPHCPQNTAGPGATATAAPASATQRHATVLFLGSILMVPSAVLQRPGCAQTLPRERRTLGRRPGDLQETCVSFVLDTPLRAW